MSAPAPDYGPGKDPMLQSWLKVMRAVAMAVQPDAEIAIDLDTSKSINKQVETFYEVFNRCARDHTNVVVTLRKGVLYYRFRGEAECEQADWIGVPAYDTIYYISNDGRVASTGSRAVELAALLECGKELNS